MKIFIVIFDYLNVLVIFLLMDEKVN